MAVYHQRFLLVLALLLYCLSGRMMTLFNSALIQIVWSCNLHIVVLLLQPTENIHGVLGQTYRKDHAQRAEEFSLIAAKLHHNIQADGPEGLGFLDGVAADYKTSGVLTADSKFNVYNPAVVRAT
eukprot:TRINITY_DN44_c0_g1_i2.p1 TRINITY_DN44_c0_g1~~TRINITY_DN44_c0_g1_i2.p1  ORF type:complete len:125 (-),score=9.77 TRINITY_DN44_c0_g1_i2:854-1228(-)